MKRNLWIVLLTAALMMSAIVGLSLPVGAAEPFEVGGVTVSDADGDGKYEIGDADALYAFAAYVNAGNLSAGAELTADITVNADMTATDLRTWTPIGSYNSRYEGEFAGDGHTVSGLYTSDANGDYVGLFGATGSGAVITAVTLTDSRFTGDEFVGGLVGYQQGSISHGYVYDVTVSGNDYVGVLAGYLGGEVANAFAHGAGAGFAGHVTGQVSHGYALDTLVSVDGVKAVSAEAFASGELAYLVGAGQTVGTHPYPVYGGETVYRVQTDGMLCSAYIYSNQPQAEGVALVHDATVLCDNGFCAKGCYEPALWNAEQNAYEIGNAGQLYWFAQKVNAGSTAINAVLTADIVDNKNVLNADGSLNGDGSNFRMWTLIQGYYSGIFDGQGHTISGIYHDDGEPSAGLFNSLLEGGAIKNLGIVDSYFCGAIDAAPFVAGNAGLVQNCYSTATVFCIYDAAYSNHAGGLTGINFGTVENCYFAGRIFGDNDAIYMGAIAGINDDIYGGGIAKNCYFDTDKFIGDAFEALLGDTAAEKVEGKTANAFANGEVANLLGEAFGQNIDNGKTNEGLPVLGGARVYLDGDCRDGSRVYTNDSRRESDIKHIPDSNGFCTVCGGFEEPTLNGSGYYVIDNAGKLYWFAKQVNSGNTFINGMLTKDIVVNENVLKSDGTLNGDGSSFRAWTPIGSYNASGDPRFFGTFDGQGYSVSGLYFSDDSARGVALFGCAGLGSTVKNVGVIDSYIHGQGYVGGIVGVGIGVVENCYNTGSVSCTESWAGGVVGWCGNTIKNCYNTGSVSGPSEIGGIAGILIMGDENIIENCYYLNTVATGGLDDEDVAGKAEGKTAEQFASGEVAYLLGSAFGQKIGTDALPVLGGDTVYRYFGDGHLCSEKDIYRYSNTLTASGTLSHDTNAKLENGFCPNCDYIGAPAIVDGQNWPALGFTIDNYKDYLGYYAIRNAGELYWFAALVNEGNADINAVLICDIVDNETVLMSDGSLSSYDKRMWTSIDQYNGTFDGRGHIISGLYQENMIAVMFGILSEDGVVKDLGIEDSYFSGKSHAATFAMENYGLILNCYSMATVYGLHYDLAPAVLGGFVGENRGTVENCYFAGRIFFVESGLSPYIGAITGMNRGTLRNCYFDDSRFAGAAFGYREGNWVVEKVASKMASDFASGEVAYLLGAAFGQEIGVDEYPVLGGMKVYADVDCKDGTLKTITNTENPFFSDGTHTLDDNGFCEICGGFEEPELNSNGYYEIDNMGKLYWFAARVNQGYPNINAILTKNIEDPSTPLGERVWIPIGTSVNRYSGTFDGNGYTIKHLYVNDSKQSNVGLFGMSDGAKIKNVGVESSYFAGNYGVGAIIGYAMSNTTIENCYSTSTVAGDSFVGGIVGTLVMESSVTNCYNTGTVLGTQKVGGVVGEILRGTVTNCYSTGTVEGDENVGGIAGSNKADCKVENSYFSTAAYAGNAIGTGEGSVTNVVGKSADAFASGEVAYLLGEAFGQEIGKDALPVLDGMKVYQNTTCGGTKYDNEQKAAANDHDYDNGFCKNCDGYEEPALNSDGYYEIDNAGKLYWFAAAVNGGNVTINAILTKDIVVNEGVMTETSTNVRQWMPIGNYMSDSGYAQFRGIFDGDGYTISGLYFNNEDQLYVGLFGYVKGGTVKNVGVVNSYIKGDKNVGGVVGINQGDIENCYNTGTVVGVDQVGGVVGQNYNSGLVIKCYNTGTVIGADQVGGVAGRSSDQMLKHCYNTGAISGTEHVGGVVGYIFDCTVQDCYSTGTVTGTTGVGGVAGYVAASGTVKNSYFNSETYTGNAIGTNDGTAESVAGKTTAQFASGEVAYLLQGENTEAIWGQTLGEEATPVIGGEKVYAASCGTSSGYSNAESAGHPFVNGFCTACGAFEEPELNSNGYYEIDNAGKLYWFAAKVNAGSTEINAVLTADIVDNKNVLKADGSLNGDGSNFRMWTIIQEDYNGIFDGQGHTISGIYHDDEDPYAGLFNRLLENSVIKDLGIVDSYFCGEINAATLAKRTTGLVQNCYSTATVSCIYNSGYSNYAGGLIGANLGTVENCYFAGRIFGDNDEIYMGAIAGLNDGSENEGIAQNCYFDTDKFIGDAFGNLLDGPVIENVAGKSADAFASGEVAYLLGEAFGQEIGEDALPVLGGMKVYANTTCGGTKYDNEQKAAVTAHTFDNNGFCLACGGYETPDTTVIEGVTYYDIDNAGKLYWFAKHVNDGYVTANAILTADIVVNQNVLKADGTLNGTPSRQWTPIGLYYQDGSLDRPFRGIFNGNSHTVSGLYCTESDSRAAGLFGYGTACHIHGVGVIDSYITAGSYRGGVIGFLNEGQGVLENSFFRGTVLAGTGVGGVAGSVRMSSIKNCYAVVKAEGVGHIGGVVGALHEGMAEAEHCYFDNSVYRGVAIYHGSEIATVTGKSTEQFASGEVAYLLGEAFGQTLGTEAYPTLGGATVYEYGAGNCSAPGSAYSNEDKKDAFVHDDAATLTYVTENGKLLCAVCGTEAVVKVESSGSVSHFAKIESALAHGANAESTITLLADVTEDIEIDSAAVQTIDLGGFRITANNVIVAEGTTVVLSNGAVDAAVWNHGTLILGENIRLEGEVRGALNIAAPIMTPINLEGEVNVIGHGSYQLSASDLRNLIVHMESDQVKAILDNRVHVGDFEVRLLTNERYTGERIEPTIDVFLGATKLVGLYTLELPENLTDAGTYNIKVILADTVITAENKSEYEVPFVIEQGRLLISGTSLTLPYGADPTKGVFNATVSSEYDTQVHPTGTFSSVTLEEDGKYYVTFTPDDDNYETTTVEVDGSVYLITTPVTLEDVAINAPAWIINGQEAIFTVTAKNPESGKTFTVDPACVVFEYKVGENGTWAPFSSPMLFSQTIGDTIYVRATVDANPGKWGGVFHENIDIVTLTVRNSTEVLDELKTAIDALSGLDTESITALADKITALETAIDKAKTDIEAAEESEEITKAIAQAEATLTAGIEALTRRVTALEGKLDGIDLTQIAANKADIATIKTAVETLQAICSLREGTAIKTALDTVKNELEAKIAALTADVTALAGRIATLENIDHAGMQQAIDTLRADLNAYPVAADLHRALTDIASILTRLTQAEADIDALEQAVATLEGLVGGKDVTAIQTALADVTARLQTLEAMELDKALETLAAVEKAVKTLQETTATHTSDIAANKANITALQTAIATMQTTLEQLAAKDTELASKIKDINDKLDSLYTELDSRLDTAEADIDALQKAVNELKTLVGGNSTDIGAIKTALENVTGRLEVLEKMELDKALETLAALNAAVTAINGNIDSMELDIAANADNIGKLGEQIKQINSTLAGLTQKTDTLDNSVNTLTTNLEELSRRLTKRLDEAEAKITALEQAATELRGLIGQNTTSISAITAQMKEVNEKLAALEDLDAGTRLNAVEKTVALLDEAVKALVAKTDDIEKTAGNNAGTIIKLDLAVSDIRDTLKDLANGDSDIARSIADLENNLSLLSERLNKIEGRLDNAELVIEKINAAIEALKQADDDNSAALSAAISSLRSSISSARAAASAGDMALDAKIEEAEKALEEAINTLKADLASAIETLNAADATNAAALAKAIETLNSTIETAKAAAMAAAAEGDTALDAKLTEAKTALEASIKQAETNLSTAKTELTAAIAAVKSDLDKAQKSLAESIAAGDKTLDTKITALAEALATARAALEAADAENKAALEAKIEASQVSLETAIAAVKSDLDKAQKALAESIALGDKTLDAKITALTEALTTARAALEAADADNKASLEAKIDESYASLSAAIAAVQKNLDAVKSQLEKADADAKAAMEAKDKDLQTFIIVVCAISGTTFCGSTAFVLWFFLSKKRKF